MSRLAVVVFAFVVLACGSLFAAPVISSLSPTTGASGTSVTITGSHFGSTQGTSTVTFGGVAAQVSSWGNGSIVALVPSGIANGAVGVVVTVSGTASNSVNFTINNPVPSISSLSPTSGASGISVTITGSNFGSTKGSSTVTFGGVTASTTSWGSTSIVATVPSGLANGAVSVVVTVNGNASNSATFTVNNPTPPSITSLSPTSGPTGTSVTITGNYFGATKGSSYVAFGTYVASTTTWSNTSITAVVPSGMLAGTVGVVVKVNNAISNSVNFTVTNPAITSLSINSAPQNQLITINGVNFGASQGTNSSVTVNGITGIPSSWSDTAISVPVPTGATTGNIVVSVNGNASPGVAFMVVPAPQPPGVHFIQGDYLSVTSLTGPPTTNVVPFPIVQTAGDLNVVVVGWQGTKSITSVTDSASNTYVLAVGPTTNNTRHQAIYYAKNISAATSNTVTVGFSSTQAPISNAALGLDVRIAEYSGLDRSSPLDVVATAIGTGSPGNSGSATTTNQNDLLVGASTIDGLTSGPGTNYTNRVIPLNSADTNSDILEDRIVTATGSYNATSTLTSSPAWILQMVALKEAQNQAPMVNAGSNQTITLPTNSVTLNGTATDDGLPNNTLTISWTEVSGPGTVTFNTPNAAVTDATFPVAGTYVLQLTANDSQLSSSSNVTITVSSQPISLVLNPLAAGPDVTGTSQTMTAVLKNGTGPTSTPISGVSVAFTVTGANATSGNRTTDTTGTATFTYTGANSGTDTVTAAYTGQNSNSANVSWLVPAHDVSTATPFGRFFRSDGSGGFDTLPTATPAFTQYFPTINFNPPSGTVPGTPPSINVDTRPFTDVTTDLNGNFTGSIVAQGNGYQAGVGSLFTFQAVFTGTLTVATAGNKTINFNSDDGFIIGIGGGATRVSGPMVNPPASGFTAFTGLSVLGAFNTATSPVANTVVVNFPTPGSYPYELDYTECCGGEDSLTMTVGSSNSPGVPPSGTLYLSPISPASVPTGQTQSFTVLVTDASGTALQNTTVALIVTGANQRQLTAATDSTGHASLQYSGTNAGTDSVQAAATVSGMGAYSNLVNMTWTVAAGSGAITFVPQGWIGSPTIGAVVQGQVPVTTTTNLSSGTLTYWPTSNPGAVTTLNANTTGSGTIGTFDATVLASGGYTIQLNAVSNGTSQVSQITVSVVGDNKPGRFTSTVTEFKVPLAGIPIALTRTYDSLDRSKIEDFGFGWKLGTFVDLSVDAQNNVTLNFNGQKVTFFFNPQPVFLFGSWLTPAYTPQSGVHGSLASDGCGGLLRLGSGLVCFPNTGQTYQPTVYAYTDPIGRTYTITASGQLQSIKDLNGNTITVTPNGITSSVGNANIRFVRDGTGRITDIFDLNQNDYHYSYDGSGNLQSVQHPALTQADTYTYFPDHSLKTETDPNSNPSSALYYSSVDDGGQTALDGRLESITGPFVPDPSGNGSTVQYTTRYAYNLTTNTTTITNPDGGTVTRKDDNFGKPLSITEQLNGSTSRTTTYQYDSSENLIQVTDPLNHTTNYTYDANGFQTSVQLQGLPGDSKTYNQFGGVTSHTDAAGTNTITTTYDANFNPSQVTDRLNGAGSPVATLSNYDSMGNFADSTDANGKATHFDYYQTGPQTGYLQDSIQNASQEKTSFTYDAMGQVLTKTDACGNGSCSDMTGTTHTTTYVYDQLERVSTITDATGVVTKYLYDNNNNKTDEYDAYGNATLQRHTQYQYDGLNRVSKITYADATTTQFFYDFRANKTTEIDQLGHVTKYAYDLAGQLTSVIQANGTPDAGTVSYAYYLDGRQQTMTDENNQSTGLHTTNNYDPAGRLTSVQDPLGNLTSYGYDADGRRTSVTEPNNQAAGLSTTYTYDARSRVKLITYPPTPTQPATTMQYTYDGMGRVLTSQDQGGISTTKTYDEVGRLKTVTDALTPTAGTTTYAYDLNGNLQSIQDANQHTTQFQYDGVNRRSHRVLPLSQTEDYSYDALGRLKTKTDFNRKTTTYNYDLLDRTLSKVPDPSLNQPTVTFTYTLTGQRLSMTDPSGATNYTSYDNRDRLLVKTTPEGNLTYTYDLHGNVTGIQSSNANGAWMTYFYDAWNRLASAKDNRVAAQGGSSNPTTYGYDATGNLTGYLYPNTVQTTNLFDPLNRLTQTCSATSSPACSAGTKLSSYLHGLAPAGNRLSVTELNGRLVSYGYDNDYRLTSEAISTDPAGNNGTVSYGPNGYDAVGNRVFMSSSLNAVPGGTFSYDVNDRLATDIYDANGSTISQAGIPNTYDFENRMLTHGGVTLVYDGDGNRVSETIGGVTTKFLVDDHNPTGLPQVLDEILSGAVTRTYAHGFQRISENQLISGTWTPSFYGYDGHGNVRFLTSSVGTITDTYQYDAFGMQIARTGTTPNVFQYSGEWLDSNVGLYYLRARYLNQATGRFWARDPVEGKKCCGLSWNPYIYVKDNAVNSVDPTGRATFTAPQPGLRGAIGGAIGEYTALLQNVSIRVFIISQITIPAYLQTPQGKALVALTLTGVSIAVHYNCGFIELTNWLTDFLEDLSGPNVRGPGLYCNEQPHDYEGEGK